MANIVIYFYFYYMETLDHVISHAWLHFNPTTLCREGEKPSEYCNFLHFADGGNRTQAVSSASECAIHYTIVSRLPLLEVCSLSPLGQRQGCVQNYEW